MTNKKFKKWEVALIVTSILLIMIASFFVATHKNIYPILLGLKDSDSKNLPIGKLEKETGEVKRQPEESPTFKVVHSGQDLHNEDMIITSTAGGATLALDDGSSIELGPNTMVKLSMDQRLGLGGVTRNANINIVAGQVKATTKNTTVTLKSLKDGEVKISQNKTQEIQVANAPVIKPKPKTIETPVEPIKNTPPSPTPPPIVEATATPEPTQSAAEAPAAIEAKILYPTANARLELPKNTQNFVLPLTIKAMVGSDNVSVILNLKKKSTGESVLNKTLQATHQQIAEEITLQSPGQYRLELLRADGKPWDSAQQKTQFDFQLTEEAEVITLNSPLVGGKPLKEVKTDEKLLKNFEINLSWTPVPQVTEYTLTLLNPAQNNKVILKKKISGTSTNLSKGQVFSGSFKYQVTAKTVNGFTIKSNWGIFEFKLNNPTLTSPANQSTFGAGETLLLVWSKVSFAEKYSLEIYADQNFKKVLLKQQVGSNFFSLKNIKPGSYYWRVRATSKSAASDYSSLFSFTVK